MRKTLVYLIALILIVSTTVAFAAPPKEVTINAAQAKQPAVKFPHDAHLKVVKACDTCHHTNKGLTADSKATVEKCSKCHLDPKNAKAGNIKDASLTTNPFHKLCVTCHKAEKKGPVMCNKCHVKG